MDFFEKYLKYKNKYIKLKKLNQKGGVDVTITIKYKGELVKNKDPISLVISKDYTGLMIKQKIFAEDSRLNIERQSLIRSGFMIDNDQIPNFLEGDEVTVYIHQDTPRLSVPEIIAEINRKDVKVVPNYLPPSAFGLNIFGKW